MYKMARFCRQLHYSRDVNKTFFTRPRLLFQDQEHDRDCRNFPRPRPSFFWSRPRSRPCTSRPRPSHSVR